MDRKDEPAPSSTQVVDRTHYDEAARLGDAALDPYLTTKEATLNLQLAAVHAQLAQVDAIDRLTAVLEAKTFPALEVSGSVLKGNCRVRPVTS